MFHIVHKENDMDYDYDGYGNDCELDDSGEEILPEEEDDCCYEGKISIV
jgi:hypothetical protein